ncbi:MAG TPA: DNA internalization-related competence protein ComEC/Rec2 [Desulfobacteraceae bacterium]|nr:DNA internalization-related competence protein ComEC/Rec2 [Desulfobacteraceae bacterium]
MAPLLLPFLALAAGIIAGDAFPLLEMAPFRGALLASLFFLLIPGLGIVPDRWRGGPGVKFASCLLLFFTGYLLILLLVTPPLQQNHVLGFADHGKCRITGKIVSTPQQSGRKYRMVILAERIGLDLNDAGLKDAELEDSGLKGAGGNDAGLKGAVPVTGRIRLSVYGGGARLRYGDRIAFAAKIRSIHNFNNPGGFDYKRYLQLRGIYASAYTNMVDVVLLPRDPSPGEKFLSSIDRYRERFSRFIGTTLDGQDAAALLSALVTGKRELVDDTVEEAFSRAGIIHLLAISGLHMSIIAALVFYLFNRLFSLCRFLLIRGWAAKAAAIATLGPLLFYGFLSGFAPSTQRAFIMISVFMVSLAADREPDSLNTLACAGILILLCDPGALFSISFQLSFTAVLFIVLGLAGIRKYQWFRENRIAVRFFLFGFISFCAIAGTSPIAARYFNVVSFAGLVVNLAAIPLVGFLAVPLGLAALFLFPLSSAAAALPVKAAGFLLDIAIALARYTASLPFAWARVVTPDRAEMTAYYLVCAGLLWFLHRHKKKGALFLAAGLVLVSLAEARWVARRFFNDDLVVTVLDVGQGSSTLIELPMGRRVLVDGGGFSYGGTFDTGRYLVAPLLWRKKIKTLDAVVLTHPEADHMNGLVYIAENFTIHRFIKNRDQRQSKAYRDLMAALARRNTELVTVCSREQRLAMGGAVLEFLHPECRAERDDPEDFNNHSVVFRLTFQETAILFPGDIMAGAEAELGRLPRKRLAAEILLAPHHGSATSSSDFFLDQVAPESVVISCGWRNRFGFPSPSVLQRYRNRGVTIHRTDVAGAVQIVSSGTEIRVVDRAEEGWGH